MPSPRTEALGSRLRALSAPLLRPASSRAWPRAAREAFARARTSPESVADDYSSPAVPSADSRRSRLSSGVSREGLASATFGSSGRFHAARLRSHSRASTSVRSTVARSPLKRSSSRLGLRPGATRRGCSGERRELCEVSVPTPPPGGRYIPAANRPDERSGRRSWGWSQIIVSAMPHGKPISGASKTQQSVRRAR